MAELLELDFFNVAGERQSRKKFSRRESGIELEICNDYELARECPRLIEFILAWKDREQKALAWVEIAPEFARSMDVPEGADVDIADKSVWRPFLPTAVLLAGWFPKPWLYGTSAQRQKIVEALSRSYDVRRALFIRPYPLDPEEENFIRDKIAADNSRKKHPANLELYVIAIDWTEPLTRLRERFVQWHRENHPIVKRQALLAEIKHLKGTARYAEILSRFPVIPPERKAYRNFKPYQLLERVTCYRLWKMNRVDRVEALANLRWLKVKNLWKKMDEARKAVLEDLEARRYLEQSS
jgi:hypothetical protein